MKVVLDNISSSVRQQDLVDFARRYNFEPTFTRITANGNHGIIEFSTIDERDDALNKLNGVEFMGNVVAARPYFQREAGLGRDFRPKNFSEGTLPSNSIYDDIKTGEDWTKNQNGSEWLGNTGGWAEKEGDNKNGP